MVVILGTFWKQKRDVTERNTHIQQKRHRNLVDLDTKVQQYNHLMQTAQTSATSIDAIDADIKKMNADEVNMANTADSIYDPVSHDSAIDANKIMTRIDDDNITADRKKQDALQCDLQAQVQRGSNWYKQIKASPLYIQYYQESSPCLDGATVVNLTRYSAT